MQRRVAVLVFLAAASALALIVAFDFIQPTRQVPELVPKAERADRLLVEKGQRQLTLFRDGTVVRKYRVALGRNPIGDKEQEGDGRTPVGLYSIDYKNSRSAFHLSLHISYPDATDREEAQRRGVSPGGDIMVHGLPNGLAMLGGMHWMRDWTNGCVAVTDNEIEEIWAMTDVGTAIEIRE